MIGAQTQPEIYLDGNIRLASIVDYGSLVITENKHGPYELTWSITAPPGWHHPLFKAKTIVEVFYAGLPIWGGRIANFDRDGGTLLAKGFHREAEGAACLNAAGRPTTEVNTAIDEAIDRDVVSWRRIDDWGSGAMMGGDGDAGTDDPEGLKLDALLDAKTAELGVDGSEWRVDAHRRLTQYTPDDDVKWIVPPGTVQMGIATDDRVDAVILSYRDSGDSDHRRATQYPASTPVNGIEEVASVDKTVSITSGLADTYARTIYRRLGAGKDGWTNGITLGPGQLLTPGGQWAHPMHPKSGDMVCLLGVMDPRDGVFDDLKFRIDTAQWDVGARTLQLNPVGMADRSFESIARHVLPKPKKKRSTRAHKGDDD